MRLATLFAALVVALVAGRADATCSTHYNRSETPTWTTVGFYSGPDKVSADVSVSGIGSGVTVQYWVNGGWSAVTGSSTFTTHSVRWTTDGDITVVYDCGGPEIIEPDDQ